MTEDNLLEVGDQIQMETAYVKRIGHIDKIYKRSARFIHPCGAHIILDKETDGKIAKLPRNRTDPFAVYKVIPKSK